jgi:hypothetical protein
MLEKSLSQKRADAGRLGGIATREKHGAHHFRKAGKKGAASTWSKYRLAPIGQSGWAMVDRETDQVKTFINYIPGR